MTGDVVQYGKSTRSRRVCNPNSELRGATTLLADGLRAGNVYRREDLAHLSNSVDRHLRELVSLGRLHKLSHGLYYVPKQSSFGPVPPTDEQVVKGFLKDKIFLYSPTLNATLLDWGLRTFTTIHGSTTRNVMAF